MSARRKRRKPRMQVDSTVSITLARDKDGYWHYYAKTEGMSKTNNKENKRETAEEAFTDAKAWLDRAEADDEQAQTAE